MNLYEAIFVRKSVRKYRMERLEDSQLAHLNTFIKNMQPLKTNIEVDYFIVDNCNKDANMKGLFQVEAPYYLLLSSELKQDYLLNVGYLLQQVVLYLTSKSIGTCYQGDLRPNTLQIGKMKYEYVIALAFGKGSQEIFRESKKAKRLNEKDIVVYKEEPEQDLLTLMKAARLAPSSFNHQPWRFVAYQNRIHVFCKKGYFNKEVLSDKKLIDIGIMLYNITIAAEELWINIVINDLEHIKDRRFKNVEYVTSVLIKEEVNESR